MESPENQALQVSVKLQAKDYSDFNLYYTRRSMIGGGIFYFFIFISLLLYLAWKDGFDPLSLPSTLIIGVVGGILVSVLVTAALRFATISKSKRIYATDKLLAQQQDYTISRDGVRMEMESGAGTVKWDELYKASETRDAFYLFLAKNKALLIPKRSFTEASQSDQFKEISAGQLPPAKLHFLKERN